MSRCVRLLVLLSVLLGGGPGCVTLWKADFHTRPDAVPTSAAFIKAHTAEGRVFVLQNWRIDPGRDAVDGVGVLYDAERNEVTRGSLHVPLSEVVMIESTTPLRRARGEVIGMAILTGATTLFAALCLSEPDACGF